MEKALDFLDRNESEPTAEQLAELTAELEEGDEDGAPGGAAEAKVRFMTNISISIQFDLFF